MNYDLNLQTFNRSFLYKGRTIFAPGLERMMVKRPGLVSFAKYT